MRCTIPWAVGTTIWSPQASGISTGKYNDGIPADSRVMLLGYEWLRDQLESAAGQDRQAKVAKLAVLARKVGLPIHHLALLLCLANPRMSTVILGASRVSQLTDNLGALDNRHLMTDDVMADIEEIVQNRPDGLPRY